VKYCLGVLLVLLASGCSLVRQRSLADKAPPLLDMEEPLELRDEPADEGARLALDPGSFTGIYVASRAASLDALSEDNEGVLVQRVVENSPADLAGVIEGDVILEAKIDARRVTFKWPSEWRALEVETAAGTKLDLLVDRAAVETRLVLTTVPRVRPPDRTAAERFREEEKVGLVVRCATEVEARAAHLGPGGGAVIVGLSRASPWRKAGLKYGDMITRVDGVAVAHCQVLIDAIRAHKHGEKLALEVVSQGASREVSAPLGRREHELHEFSIPLLYDYTSDRGRSETSILFGIYNHESTSAAWHTRLLWIIHFGGGEADQLDEERS
jgi:predicted metalloprotease with PDZ domain